MKKYVSIVFILFSQSLFSQTLPSQVTFTVDQIVHEKIELVDKKNPLGNVETPDYGIFGPASSSQGLNLSSAAKSQQVGLDLGSEASGLRGKVISEQTGQGMTDPQGCADASVLSDNHKNICTAATTLESLGIKVLEGQSEFQGSANHSYNTMEDVSAYPLNNSAVANFAANSNGVPVSGNMLYPTNKQAIDYYNLLFKSLDATSQYKGLKYSTKNNYVYIDGKKYPTSVLSSREAMIKAGISKSIANFAYGMLSKKAKLAQTKISSLLKNKNLFDGKKWNIVQQMSGDSIVESSETESSTLPPNSLPSSQSGYATSGHMDLSSSLVEETTLYRTVDGIPLGLSSDNIFKIVSRKYREKDKLGFFHNSPKK